MQNYRGGDDLADLLTPAGQWLIPLNIHGKSRACLTVGFMDGEWQVVGISLGDFGEYINELPAEFRPGEKRGKFVRIFSLHTDFIAIGSGEETRIALPSYTVSTLVFYGTEIA